MQSLKNIVKNSRLMALVGLIIVIVAVDSFAMKRFHDSEHVGQLGSAGQYGFYASDDDSDKIVWVNKQVILSNSKTLSNMLEDLGEEINKIPLHFPFATIKLIFDVLQNHVDINGLSFEQLCNVATAFNYLDVPIDTMNMVLWKIKKAIDSNDQTLVDNTSLQQLNDDLQKMLFLEPTVDFLKSTIISKYVDDRNKVLVSYSGDVKSVVSSHDSNRLALSFKRLQHGSLLMVDISDPSHIVNKPLLGLQGPVSSVAFSPDDTMLVAGSLSNQNNCIAWNVSDWNDITHKELVGHQGSVRSVAFSRDGKSIASCSDGGLDNCIVWDISDWNNITHKVLVTDSNDIRSVAFSPDGKSIVLVCNNQHNLILRDISNLKNISHTLLRDQSRIINSVEFSPDGKMIVVGMAGTQNNLILFDTSDLNNITHKQLVGHQNPVCSAVFSPDGKMVVSGSAGRENNCILWDISDWNNITHQKLVGHQQNGVKSVAFSPDGKMIVSGEIILVYLGDYEANCILWNISNPKNIIRTKLVGHQQSIGLLSFSPDGNKVISGTEGLVNNCILWILVTEQEQLLLNQMNSYTAAQIGLIYQLCRDSLQFKKFILLQKSSKAYTIFMTLPEQMRHLLDNLFKIVVYG